MEPVSILVCHHKPGPLLEHPGLLPVHVGSTLSPYTLPMQRDDQGENISANNPSYCELTACYWAWKNLPPAGVIGLAHYRRYFDLADDSPWANLTRVVRWEELEQRYAGAPDPAALLQGRDIVLPRPRYLSQSVEAQYRKDHRGKDLDTLRAVIGERCPVYGPAFERVMRNHHFSPYNMFIARRERFDAYAAWLFDLLEEVERRVAVPMDDSYQRRIFGFLGERLLNVYLEHHSCRVIYRPVLYVGDDLSVKPNVRYQVKRLFYSLQGK